MAHYWLFLQEYDNHPKKRNRVSLPSHKKQITYEKKNHYSRSKSQWKKYVWFWQGKFQALCIFTEVGPKVLQKSMGLLADCHNFPVMANKVSTALVPPSSLTAPAWWYVCFFLKTIPWNSCTVGDWGDGTAGKVLAVQTWAPLFSPPNPHDKPGVGATYL